MLVFSLGGWAPQIPAGYHVPDGTQDTIMSRIVFAYATVTLFGEPFQDSSTNDSVFYSLPLKGDGPTTPMFLRTLV